MRQAWLEDNIEHDRRKAQALKERANLGARFAEKTFSNYDASRAYDAYKACYTYANDPLTLSTGRGILLYGSAGTGKTHLASAIANEWIAQGVGVLFDTYTGHLTRLRNEFNDNGRRLHLEIMKNCGALVLDDVGKEKQTEWSAQVMFDVINHRYEHRKPVIITTNFNLSQLERYFDVAVFSRLCETCVAVQVVGADYRRQGGAK